MDRNTALVIGGLIALMIVLVLVVRKRIRSVRLPLGPLGQAEFDAGTGPLVEGNRTEGAKNLNLAKGDGAEVTGNTTIGNENQNRAET